MVPLLLVSLLPVLILRTVMSFYRVFDWQEWLLSIESTALLAALIAAFVFGSGVFRSASKKQTATGSGVSGA
jgi:hypothetical protein